VRRIGCADMPKPAVWVGSDVARPASVHPAKTDTKEAPMPRRIAVPVVIALAAATAAPALAAAETDYVASLRQAAQYPSARGHSEYDREGTKREVEVTVSGIRRLAGRRVRQRYQGRHDAGLQRRARPSRVEHFAWPVRAERGRRIHREGPHERRHADRLRPVPP